MVIEIYLLLWVQTTNFQVPHVPLDDLDSDQAEDVIENKCQISKLKEYKAGNRLSSEVRAASLSKGLFKKDNKQIMIDIYIDVY